MKALLIAAAAGAVAGGILLGGAVGVIQQARIDREVAAHAMTKQAHAQAAAKAEAENRAEERRRRELIDEVQRNAQLEIESVRRDAAAAGVTADRLRAEVASLRQRVATGDPVSTLRSPAGTDALDLLAELLSRADGRAGELAAHLDRSRVAGLACERAYDRLRND